MSADIDKKVAAAKAAEEAEEIKKKNRSTRLPARLKELEKAVCSRFGRYGAHIAVRTDTTEIDSGRLRAAFFPTSETSATDEYNDRERIYGYVIYVSDDEFFTAGTTKYSDFAVKHTETDTEKAADNVAMNIETHLVESAARGELLSRNEWERMYVKTEEKKDADRQRMWEEQAAEYERKTRAEMQASNDQIIKVVTVLFIIGFVITMCSVAGG